MRQKTDGRGGDINIRQQELATKAPIFKSCTLLFILTVVKEVSSNTVIHRTRESPAVRIFQGEAVGN